MNTPLALHIHENGMSISPEMLPRIADLLTLAVRAIEPHRANWMSA
jgi:hypothetical protein